MINYMILLLACLSPPSAAAFSDSLANSTREEKTLSIFNVVSLDLYLIYIYSIFNVVST